MEDKNPVMPCARYSDGDTALHEAAKGGKFSICQLIIKNTTNLNPMNRMNKTPLDLAEENGHLEVSELIKSAIKDKDETQ